MNRTRRGFFDYVFGAALLITLIAFLTFGFWVRADAPCSWFDLAPVKDVPARCLMHR